MLNIIRISLALFSLSLASTLIYAEPKTYVIDSSHTYPSFEADHQGGLSLWRGKINSNSGTVVLDKEAETGSVEVIMDMSTVDFGHDGMNRSAQGANIFDLENHPTATYTGTLTNFVDGAPTSVDGELTLKGVTQPLTLTINSFLCKPHFRSGNEICGADASATFNRGDFGVSQGLEGVFFPEVKILISIEAGLAE